MVTVVTLLVIGCSPQTDPRSDTAATPDVTTSVPRPLMPEVLCLTLQDAQDLIQDQGVYYSRSEDASGENRNQVYDANWIVIEQNISPGQPIDEGDVVLKVLKRDEVVSRGLCQ